MSGLFEDMTVILASASPRRTELLSQAGIRHIVRPSGCEEKITSCVPKDVVMELAEQKAEDVFSKYKEVHPGEDFLVIGSDTVVAAEQKILGKPVDDEDAFCMISMLQGQSHQVYTGVAILIQKQGKETRKIFFERSDVMVYPMSEEEIRGYIATGDCKDKAGSYGIQGRFAVYIRRIQGDYNNIVGLPIARIYQELKGETR